MPFTPILFFLLWLSPTTPQRKMKGLVATSIMLMRRFILYATRRAAIFLILLYIHIYLLPSAILHRLSLCHFLLTALSSDRQLATTITFLLNLQHATCNAFLHHLPFNLTAKPFISWQRLIKWLFSSRSFEIKSAQPHSRCMCATYVGAGRCVCQRKASKMH